ncbi:sugar transferase [Marinobacter halodurans]|uniref:sugar transferase n=1 Tax=Marinobacter halodurans TaxID=2528979 RepID=UPI001F607356|nr:sugar transferase [Marinobacter halodurans]
MIRSIDLTLAGIGLLLGAPVFFLLLIVGLFDTGSPLFVQERVGLRKKPFRLVKFRTMNVTAKSVATHLANSSDITSFGRFLRKTKLDELPQLWNVFMGDMSIVGPRPCLFSQEELIMEREVRGVLDARPGITGLAQVNGIDMSTPKLLAETDQRMLQSLSLKMYFKMILLTVAGKGSGDRIRTGM